jgi:hypothetical protein
MISIDGIMPCFYAARCDESAVGNLDRKQPVKERPVASQRLPQILGGNIVPPVPPLLQLRAPLGKLLSNPPHDCSHQAVCLFYCRTRFIYEAGLNLVPLRAKIMKFFFALWRVSFWIGSTS